ncbi:MAG: sigma-70 family RNA polymerase sigma factor, partial [Polyangiaceae bacterium]
STLRTWAYTLARHASFRHLRGVRRRRAESPLSEASVAEKVAQGVRTATRPWLQTRTKDRFAQIRETLPPEDQMLLLLRVDQGLSWGELARVLGEGEAPSDEGLKREAAKLRKRFQALKEKLVEIAKREGLMDGEHG